MHALNVAFWLLFASVAMFVAWSFFRMFVLDRQRESPPRKPPDGPLEPRNESGGVESVGLAGAGVISSDASSYADDLGGGGAASDAGSDSGGGDSGGGDYGGGGGDYGGGGSSGGW